MTVERLIAELQSMNNPKAEVRLNHMKGDIALFSVHEVGNNDVVWIEGREDINIEQELEPRFDSYKANQIPPSLFYKDLVDTGFTLEDIKAYQPDYYEEAKKYFKVFGGKKYDRF